MVVLYYQRGFQQTFYKLYPLCCHEVQPFILIMDPISLLFIHYVILYIAPLIPVPSVAVVCNSPKLLKLKKIY